jgi:Fe-S-cluster containining protein
MECRRGCAACCTVLSISSPLPGMPEGKPAFAACVNLDPGTLRCRIWGTPDYPSVCREFTAKEENCGTSAAEAIAILTRLERVTTPVRSDAEGEPVPDGPSPTRR